MKRTGIDKIASDIARARRIGIAPEGVRWTKTITVHVGRSPGRFRAHTRARQIVLWKPSKFERCDCCLGEPTVSAPRRLFDHCKKVTHVRRLVVRQLLRIDAMITPIDVWNAVQALNPLYRAALRATILEQEIGAERNNPPPSA